MNKRVKVFSFVLSFVMIVLLSVGTTLALLTDSTDPVKNTFTAQTNLLKDAQTFKIQEHTIDEKFQNTDVIAEDTDRDGIYVEYENLFPKITIQKDPTILVGELAADAYLYVVIEQNYMTAESAYSVDGEGKITGDLFNWEIDDNTWMYLGKNGNKSLYVLKNGTAAKTLEADTNPTADSDSDTDSDPDGIAILKNNQIVVENYGNEAAKSANEALVKDASMTFSAYLVQAFGVNARDAGEALTAYNTAFTTANFTA